MTLATHQVPFHRSRKEAHELLQAARSGMRCIEWIRISRSLMSGCIQGSSNQMLDNNDLFNLSRSVQKGEVVDLFMSHSWHDDAKAKWGALVRVVTDFRARRGREPTFWLDKTCIDQRNIGNGLRVLPINVMSCERMLVLWGATYAGRLWCVWELFTLVAFASLQQALKRMILVPLEADDSSFSHRLLHFNVDDARCYDPNEETQLRRVIDGIGSTAFNGRIHALGRELERQASTTCMKSATAAILSDVFTKFKPIPVLNPGDHIELEADVGMISLADGSMVTVPCGTRCRVIGVDLAGAYVDQQVAHLKLLKLLRADFKKVHICSDQIGDEIRPKIMPSDGFAGDVARVGRKSLQLTLDFRSEDFSSDSDGQPMQTMNSIDTRMAHPAISPFAGSEAFELQDAGEETTGISRLLLGHSSGDLNGDLTPSSRFFSGQIVQASSQHLDELSWSSCEAATTGHPLHGDMGIGMELGFWEKPRHAPALLFSVNEDVPALGSLSL